MSLDWPSRAAPEVTQQPAELLPRRRIVFSVAGMALLGTLVTGLAMAALVFATDPGPREEELFIALLLIAATGLGWAFTLLFGRRSGSPLTDTLRALRRGLLFGLACCGSAILQVNNAFSLPNLIFLLLVLLIVEMVFVARRQHPL